MTEPGLFDAPRAATGHQSEDAMAAAIEWWEAAGQAVGIMQRRMLLDQAHAVDMAMSLNRPTAVSGAHRELVEMMQAFHLVAGAPPGGSAVDRFLAEVEKAANGGD